VEGATGLGHLLAQQLMAAGEQVLDVPAKLVARARLLDAGDINNNDPNDALSVAVAALRSQGPEVVASHFGHHPDTEIYASQPGLGVILSARVLAEFGDDPHRFADARARKNYAGTSPITQASGIRKVVLARYARNRRLADALHQWAFCAMRGSPGARAYYQALRARGSAIRELSTSSATGSSASCRLPRQPNALRRNHRLGTSHSRSCLTFQTRGYLPPAGCMA
jgi:transposase